MSMLGLDPEPAPVPRVTEPPKPATEERLKTGHFR
jgi:hypothetical protein